MLPPRCSPRAAVRPGPRRRTGLDLSGEAAELRFDLYFDEQLLLAGDVHPGVLEQTAAKLLDVRGWFDAQWDAPSGLELLAGRPAEFYLFDRDERPTVARSTFASWTTTTTPAGSRARWTRTGFTGAIPTRSRRRAARTATHYAPLRSLPAPPGTPDRQSARLRRSPPAALVRRGRCRAGGVPRQRSQRGLLPGARRDLQGRGHGRQGRIRS